MVKEKVITNANTIKGNTAKNETNLSEHEKIFMQLQIFAEKVPINVYWVDLNFKIVGINKKTLTAMGATSDRDIIGKTVYEIYPEKIAYDLILHAKEVVKTLNEVKREHVIQDITTKESRYYHDVMSPIFDSYNTLIGVIGTSIEITAEKNAEQLKIQNAKYQAKEKAQQKFKKVMDIIQHTIQSYKIDILNERIGVNLQYNELDKIKVTKREREILYFLALNKSPKEIAFILSILENKSISYGTIGAFINKQLYPKFGVFNTSQLIEKATILNLIPAILDPDNN